MHFTTCDSVNMEYKNRLVDIAILLVRQEIGEKCQFGCHVLIRASSQYLPQTQVIQTTCIDITSIQVCVWGGEVASIYLSPIFPLLNIYKVRVWLG